MTAASGLSGRKHKGICNKPFLAKLNFTLLVFTKDIYVPFESERKSNFNLGNHSAQANFTTQDPNTLQLYIARGRFSNSVRLGFVDCVVEQLCWRLKRKKELT